MIRRVVLAGVSLAYLVLGIGIASAVAPTGPRLAFVKWGNPDNLVLLSTGADGSDARRLAGGRKPVAMHGPVPFQGPTWSPDGSRIAYVGYFRSDKRKIFTAAPDGSDAQSVANTTGAGDPIFAPDGVTIAFSRARVREPHLDLEDPLHLLGGGYQSTTTWIVNTQSGEVRRLTPWRNGLDNSPSSFSPDGSTLALSRVGPHGHEAVALELEGGQTSLLARNAEEPVFSPDGTRVAFVSYRDRNRGEGFDGPVSASELYVKRLDGTGLQRLTRTTAQQEAAPSWDPSSSVIAYTQTTTPGGEPFGLGLSNVVMKVNADGSCAGRVFGRPSKSKFRGPLVGLYGPAWQPGSGREAARIKCGSG